MNKLLSLSQDNAYDTLNNYIDDLPTDLANKMLKILMALQINTHTRMFSVLFIRRLLCLLICATYA